MVGSTLLTALVEKKDGATKRTLAQRAAQRAGSRTRMIFTKLRSIYIRSWEGNFENIGTDTAACLRWIGQHRILRNEPRQRRSRLLEPKEEPMQQALESQRDGLLDQRRAAQVEGWQRAP